MFFNKIEKEIKRDMELLGLDSNSAKRVAYLLNSKSINGCLFELNRLCNPYGISAKKYQVSGQKRLYFSRRHIIVSNAPVDFYIRYSNSDMKIEDYHCNKNWTALSSFITVDESQFCTVL